MLLAFYVPLLASVRGWTMPRKNTEPAPASGHFLAMAPRPLHIHAVCRRLHTSLCLGQGLLRKPARSQQGPSHCRSRPRLQMDPHPLCLLEITNSIQRISLSPIPKKPPRPNRHNAVKKSPLFLLANYLRLSSGLRLPQPHPTGAFVNKPHPFSNSCQISLC
jgi:hypothetical protein